MKDAMQNQVTVKEEILPYNSTSNVGPCYATTEHSCPACGGKLATGTYKNGLVAVWCGRGTCEDEIANNGGTGKDVSEAYVNLLKSFN